MQGKFATTQPHTQSFESYCDKLYINSSNVDFNIQSIRLFIPFFVCFMNVGTRLTYISTVFEDFKILNWHNDIDVSSQNLSELKLPVHMT